MGFSFLPPHCHALWGLLGVREMTDLGCCKLSIAQHCFSMAGAQRRVSTDCWRCAASSYSGQGLLSPQINEEEEILQCVANLIGLA